MEGHIEDRQKEEREKGREGGRGEPDLTHPHAWPPTHHANVVVRRPPAALCRSLPLMLSSSAPGTSPAPPNAPSPGPAPIDALSFEPGREMEGDFWSEPEGVILNCL